jgi:WD40 repeat protein
MDIKSKLTKIFCTFSLLALITSQQLDSKTEHQVQATPTNFIAQKQETNIPSRQNRVVIIVFTGFASQTLNEITGMQKLVDAFRKEAKLDQLDLKIPIFAWDEKKDAISYLNSLGLNNNDKLIVIGHSYGGDTAILFAKELKKRNRRVDLLIQVDSVGSSDDVLPRNVAKGINYYQADDNPISLGRFKVQQEVINSTNLDVNRVFKNELISSNSYPLNHGSIDDSNVVHQAIIEQVLNAINGIAVKNTTEPYQLQRTITTHLRVQSLAYSPDGQTLASGILDNTIKLWNPKTGKLLQTITGHSYYVNSLAYSPDGQTLASGSADNTIKLWNPRSGKLLRTLSGHSGYVYSIAYSPDGQILASGSGDNTIKLWNPRSGKLLRTISLTRKAVIYSIAYSPDGQSIANGRDNSIIKLWNTRTGKLLRNLTGHFGYVMSLAYSPDGQTLASGSGTTDNTIKLWNPQTGQLLQTLTGHSGWVWSIAYSPDGQTLAGAGEGIIKLWSRGAKTQRR